MKILKTSIISVIIYFFIVSCSDSKISTNELKSIQDSETAYSVAMQDLKKEKYDEAILTFKEIIFQFPLSNEGVQSQIMLAFIDYIKLNYDESIYKFKKIINIYPSYKNIDYAYYMVAMCYFEQIKGESFDGLNNKESLKNFKIIINKFPNSEYAKDSEQKIIFINENIAAKHLNIAMFYYKEKKYLAALNRYKIIIEEYSKSKFTPEALFRMVEIYYHLGMAKEAEKTASVILYNYPKSKWYNYAYNIVKKDTTKKKFKISKKITNFFKKNEKKIKE